MPTNSSQPGFNAKGTHKGDQRGIAPTNNAIRVEGIVIHRISRGRIAEGWAVWDALGLMQQLRVVPAFGEGESSSQQIYTASRSFTTPLCSRRRRNEKRAAHLFFHQDSKTIVADH